MERRELIRWLMATAGLSCLEGLSPDEVLAFGTDLHRPSIQGAPRFRALDAHAQRTVTIAAERIIPASDTPGATDARVVSFIDRVLADWYTPQERDRFLAGLRELDARCRASRGRDFVECDVGDQNAILTAFDDEVTALRRSRDAAPNEHWFAMLKYLTAFGYCTSEVAMRQTFGDWPRPTRYDGCASVPFTRTRGG